MGKRSGTLETTLLAIELLRRIPRGRKVTAAELCAQLQGIGIERDLRTIQRQLDLLSEHFKLDRDTRSKPYGYSWPKDSDGLSVPGLNLHESLLLRLAEEHLRNLLPHLLQELKHLLQKTSQLRHVQAIHLAHNLKMMQLPLPLLLQPQHLRTKTYSSLKV